MGWFGKLAFGTMGMLLGGPLGAIAGAALGHHLVDRRDEDTTVHRQAISFGQTEQAQAAYFISMFSILGKIAKADGVVTRDEIAVVENFLSGLNIAAQEKQFARQVFNEAKDSPYSIEDFAGQLYQINQYQPAILLSFLDLLFKVAAADGKLHPGEENCLGRVKSAFRISDNRFDNLKSMYFKNNNKYYEILNCSPDSSNDEIKSGYKKLVKEFHPDTIVSKGLPEEFVQFATSKFQEIQEAYEKIRQERNF